MHLWFNMFITLETHLYLEAIWNQDKDNHNLLLWTLNEPPVVVLDLLQLVKLHGDVVNGELQQVPEASQVLRGGPWHGTRVLWEM